MQRLLNHSATVSIAILMGLVVLIGQWVSHKLGANLLLESIQQQEIDKIKTVAAMVNSLQAQLQDEARSNARMLAGDPSVLAALQMSDPQRIDRLASRLNLVFDLHEIQMLEVVDASETLVYMALLARHSGDTSNSWGVTETLNGGNGMITSERRYTSVMIQAIEPIKLNEKILGVLSAGTAIDQEFVAKISKQIRAGVALLGRDGLIVGDSGSTSEKIDMTGVHEAYQTKIPAYRVDADSHLTSVYLPVVIVDEAYVLLIQLDSMQAYRLLEDGRNRSIWISTLVFLASLILGYLALHQLLKPLQELRKRALQLGQEHTGEPILVTGKNEVQTVVKVLDTLTQRMVQRNQDLSAATEKAQAANLAKTQFLSTMSHEIRTPLNGVLGITELLRSTRLDDTQTRFVNALSLASKSLHSLLSDILDLTKIEAGQIALESMDFDPVRVCEDAAEMIRDIASTKKLSLEMDFSAMHCRWVSGDPTRLRQVLNNLLGNAIKFTEHGKVSFRAESIDSPVDDSRHWCRLSITDTGIGMDEPTLARLFQRFTQADSSMTRRYGGSGLGLVICKNLIESMGGQIYVRSAPGQGSCFWFELPLNAAQQPPTPESEPEIEPSEPEKAHQRRILVVEDNMINQMVIRSLLEQRGASVTMANNGQLGLEAAQAQTFDLVFMDCQMPVMDGFEATRQIRAWEKTQNDRTPVPIVALTANVQESDRDACLAAGMTEFTTKPIKGEVIDRILASCRA